MCLSLSKARFWTVQIERRRGSRCSVVEKKHLGFASEEEALVGTDESQYETKARSGELDAARDMVEQAGVMAAKAIKAIAFGNFVQHTDTLQ